MHKRLSELRLVFFTVLAFAPVAHSLEAPDLKNMLCPFNFERASEALEHEYREHGGARELGAAIEAHQAQFGPCLDLKAAAGGAFELIHENATIPIELTFAEGNKIKSAFLGIALIRNDSFEKILKDIGKVPYTLSFHLQTESGRELFSFAPDKPLSISRSNQIFLLRALQVAVSEKQIALTDLLPLNREKALPSFGIIQDWKAGTLLSIDSLMNLMVSEKDLTASDLLLGKIDPVAFTRFSKTLNPFLSYREYFLLAELPKEKIQGRAHIPRLLPELKGMPAPKLLRFDRIDLLDSLGWFASTRDICASALLVKDDILLRNQRLNREYQSIQPKEVVGYALIQSRDAGVSQMTTLFQTAKSREWKCLSITANHSEEVEESFFFPIASRLVNMAIAAESK